MADSINKPIRLNALFRPILRHGWIVLSCFALVVGTVAYLTFTTQPIHESKAALLIGEARNLGSMLNATNVIKQQILLKNQITVLKSRSLAQEVIRRLEANPVVDSLSKIQRATSYSDRFWLKSKKNGMPISTIEEKVAWFRENTQVVDDAETNVFILKARNADPMMAAVMNNTWIDAYKDFDDENNQSESSQTKRFLEAKLNEVENKLSNSSHSLSEYQKKNGVVSLPQESEQLIIQLANFEKQYQEARTNLEEVQNQISHSRSELDQNKNRLLDEMTNPVNPNLKELQKQLSMLIVKKAAYEAQLSGVGVSLNENESLAQMQSRIEGIQEQISLEVRKMLQSDQGMINPLDRSEALVNKLIEMETNRQALVVRIETLKSIVIDYQAKLNQMPEKSRELAGLQRNVEVNQQLYLLLKQKYEEVRIREAGETGFIQVVDRAQPPLTPILPRTKLNLILAALFGLLLGMSIAFVKDILDDYIDDAEDLEKTGLPLIGRVPYFRGSKSKAVFENQKDWKILRAKQIAPHLVHRVNGNWASSEAYRAIRTSIDYAKHESQWSTFLFTSPGPFEGKSTTVANLAITMAEKGMKTLLVDADLRKPVMDILFTGSHRNTGITKYLGREIHWSKAVRATSIDNLYLLPAGYPVLNASELLGSKAMNKMIREAKQHFAVILLDSPPILPVTDATILATMVDAVVLVVRAGNTQTEGLKQSIELLKGVKAQLLGGIITGVRGNRSGYALQYHHQKH